MDKHRKIDWGFLIFVLIVGIITLTFIVFFYNPEPKFTIIDTKVNCHNETYLDESSCFYVFESQINKSECINGTIDEEHRTCIIKDNLLSNQQKMYVMCPQYYIENNESNFSIPQKQVCSQEEVDEMEYGDYIGKQYQCFDEKQNVIFYIETEPYTGIDRINCKLIREEGKEKISKENLTTEWLEERCECLEHCANYDCSIGSNKCSKYSCFDEYEVEVKK